VGEGQRFEAAVGAGEDLQTAFGAVEDGPIVRTSGAGGGDSRVEQPPGVVDEEMHTDCIGLSGGGLREVRSGRRAAHIQIEAQLGRVCLRFI